MNNSWADFNLAKTLKFQCLFFIWHAKLSFLVEQILQISNSNLFFTVVYCCCLFYPRLFGFWAPIRVYVCRKYTITSKNTSNGIYEPLSRAYFYQKSICMDFTQKMRPKRELKINLIKPKLDFLRNMVDSHITYSP